MHQRARESFKNSFSELDQIYNKMIQNVNKIECSNFLSGPVSVLRHKWHNQAYTQLIALNFSAHLKGYIYIATFLKFQIKTPTIKNTKLNQLIGWV